jgi:hypothetical protein
VEKIAFYYTWYDDIAWGRKKSNLTPKAGKYSSFDTGVANRHIEQAQPALDAFCVSWWSKKHKATKYFEDGLLSCENIKDFKFCILYEGLGPNFIEGKRPNFNHAHLTQVLEDISYFKKNYFSNPSYYKVDGKPLLCIYVTRDWKIPKWFSQKIKTILDVDVHICGDEPFFDSLSKTSSPETSTNEFDSYFSYNMYQWSKVAKGETPCFEYMQKYAYPIFDAWSKKRFFPQVLCNFSIAQTHRAGLHRNLVGGKADYAKQMQALQGAERVFLTSFNEWWEGSSMEPSKEIDIL